MNETNKIELHKSEDEAIVMAVRGGNDFVLKRLYKDCFPIVRKYVLTNSGDDEDAKDVFQEAFIVFYNKCLDEEFNLASSIKTYVFAVAKNIWLKRLRLFANSPTLLMHEDHDFEDVEEDIHLFERKELEYAVLNDSLNRLGEPCKTILEDFFYHKLSMEEIAQKMNYTNAANAKNQKYKCFNRLKKMFLIEKRNRIQ